MSVLYRTCLVAVATALVGGCVNPLGQTGGVLPASDVGPPPSLRSDVRTPGRSATPSQVDPERVMPSEPTRRLNVPTTARAGDGSPAAGTRRIRREDLEGATEGGSASGGSLSPTMGSGGSVGVGGRF
ncbi:hypothetical protein OPKNFCMD_6399 [Methylobacterium crusticola]|uniref:Translation initiation factor IF-2 n=1 Tax=Methylobacterium crusticola TaxID=1697972 RepID=A0ABQ4R7C4_9HYPH|nr:hypothetical protein [Methylobacterium crusticola]GJD53622.1 hypothetical protein OPKNFCMD_6399 [Methylobacterium crusticola]